ncbi:hypothetical protein SOHN41_02425 [Shewanella sp. HN-41]|nr:hypothetical protein SOHN41_02425 [Shewanella sp. HN-41]
MVALHPAQKLGINPEFSLHDIEKVRKIHDQFPGRHRNGRRSPWTRK